MVNEEKVRLMAKAASFEAGEGKKALSMNRFFRGDYISLHRGLALLYLSLLGVYLVIHYVVYYNRYQQNRKKLAAYNHILKQLSHIYQTESRTGGSGLTSEGAEENEDFTGI